MTDEWTETVTCRRCGKDNKWYKGKGKPYCPSPTECGEGRKENKSLLSAMETGRGWVVKVVVQSESTLLFHEKEMFYETFEEAKAFIEGVRFIRDHEGD